MIASEKVKQQQVVVPRQRAGGTRPGAARASVPRTKRMSRSFDWAKIRSRAWLVARICLGILVVVLIGFIYRSMTSSRSFQLRTVELSGNYRVNTADVERLVKQS